MESELSSQYLFIETLIKTTLYFAVAGIIVPLLQRFKISPVLGYLICGIIIGPYGIARFTDKYSWISYISVSDSSSVHLVGELGIITLMFKIGLDLSLNRLMELKKYIFGLGTMQILVSAFCIFLIARIYNNSMEASILLGLSLSLSSTAIVMKLLDEKKLSNRSIGTLSFSVLLMQDLAVIPILILTSVFTYADINIFIAIGESIVFGIITVLLIYWLGKKVLTPLLRSISIYTTHECLSALVVFLVLFFSLVTYKAGLSLALGAFIIGLLIAETEFIHEVKIITFPIKGILLGIFFLSIGMMINVVEIINNFSLIAMSVVGIFILKSMLIFSVCMLFKVSLTNSIQAAIYLSEPGEFALMILGAALAGKVISAENVEFFMLVTVVAMMITPFVFKLGPALSRFVTSLTSKKEKEETINVKIGVGHVVIAGFGKVGKLIAEALTKQMIPYIAFEFDSKKVQELKKQNYQINYGDVRKKQLWEQLIDQKIDVAIIAIEEFEATKLTLNSIRTHFPMLPIFVRNKGYAKVNELFEIGATDVVSDSLESSLRITKLVIEKLGTSKEDSAKAIALIREKILSL